MEIPTEDQVLLREVHDMKDNWDGEGAPAATQQSLAVATGILYWIYGVADGKMTLTSLTPGYDGGVDMTWEGQHGTDLYIVIPADGMRIRYVLSVQGTGSKWGDRAGVLGWSMDYLVKKMI